MQSTFALHLLNLRQGSYVIIFVMPISYKCLLFVLLAFALLKSSVVTADNRPLVVMLASRQDAAAFNRVAESMVAQFTGSDIAFEVHWVAALPARLPQQEQLAASMARDTGAMAVLWVDLEETELVYFYLTAANSEQILVRRLDGTGEEGLADALALISKSAVDAVLEGGVIGVVPSTQAKKKKNTSAQPRSDALFTKPVKPSPEVRFFVDVSYSMSLLSLKRGLQNGACFSASTMYAGWFRVFVGYTFYQILEDRNLYVELEIKRHPIHLGVAARRRIGKVSLEGSASLVFDIMKRMPTILGERVGVEVEDPYARLGLSFIPALRVEVNLRGALSLFADLGAELNLIKRSFTFDGGLDFFEDLWRIQPRLLLGARFDLF